MLTPQQATRLFIYADWAMLLMGLLAIGVSLYYGIVAILPSNKGRRKRLLRTALLSFLVFALFYATQSSVNVAFFNEQWTPLSIVLFALPVVIMLVGIVASIGNGVRAIRRETGSQRMRIVLKSLLGVVVLGVGIAPHTMVILAPFISAEDHTNRPGTLTRIGEPVPDFQVTSTEGSQFNTADLRGKVIVLNFFATWCGPCQMELPHLQTLWDEFRHDDGFQMLIVGREESDSSIKAFQQKHGFTFPMAPDPDRLIYSKFASESIPRTYLISRQGTIVYQFTGYYEAELTRLRKLLKKELKKAPPQ